MPATTGGSSSLNQEVMNRILEMRGKQEVPETLTPEPPEPEYQVPEVVVGTGQKFFKDMFGFKAPSGREHALRVFQPEDWPDEVRCFIPKLDPLYIWPKENTEKVVAALLNGDKTLIIGPTGSGKSSLIKNVCAILNIPFIRINFFNQVEYSAVFGMPKITGGTMTYEHGPIGILGTYGGVLCLDEFSSANSDITMSLQYVLEDQGQIYLPDYPGPASERIINPHEHFRIVCTDNTELQGDTTGRHAGTNVQNTATLDRFQTVIKHDYLNKEHEKKVLKNVAPEIPDGWVKDMLTLSSLVRDSYEKQNIGITMSPRTLINWARKSAYWGEPLLALKLCWFDKLISDDRKVVNEFVMKVYGKEIK